MSQEWDIDEILASLDELLQEGKDDDIKEKEKATISPFRAIDKPEVQAVQKSTKAKNEDAKIEKVKVTGAPKAVKPISNTIKHTTLKPPKRLDIDVPDANFRHEPSVDGDAPILPRVMLTEDMMVKNTAKEASDFSPLLDAMDEEEVSEKLEEDTASQKTVTQNQGIHLNDKQLEEVLELVSMDVSYQFNQLLPNIIRKSLHKHLNMRQNEALLEQEKNKQQNEKP
ncbi:MAG: hypothetical protein Q9M18_03050 [Mariprofundaceae bacterium]|nr:hypothetical protein [Mariprofundaceae bacterium]